MRAGESLPGRRRWPQVFSQPRPLSYPTYNRTYIQHLRKALECADAEDDSNAEEPNVTGGDDGGPSNNEAEEQDEAEEPLKEEDDSLARVFMRGRLHIDAHEILDEHCDQARDVEAFCNVSFRDLEDEGSDMKGEPNVLLHERSASGEVRESHGPLHWRQLHAALQIERFRPNVNAAMSPEDAGDTGKSNEYQPDADQRRLYIHNLTPHNAAVLMCNASYHEAQATRDLLHRHVTRASEISVILPSLGFKRFSLRLCLPYHTLTNDQRPQTPRSLRVPAGRSAHEVKYLHEAKTTIQVDGCDNQAFTVIGIVDSPHSRESVQQYHSYASDISDPLTRGKTLLDCPITDPRLCFLASWEVRIAQVAAELEDIVNHLRKAAKRLWEQTAQISILSQDGLQQLPSWVCTATNLASLCRLVDSDLFDIVSTWKHFTKGDIEYFQAEDNRYLSDKMEELLGNITSRYECLEMIQTTLAKLRTDLEYSGPNNILAAQNSTVSQQIKHLTEEQVSLSTAQQLSSKEVHRLTYTGMMFLPLVLTSGLFSVSPSALPFTPSPPAFGVSLVVLVAMTIIFVSNFDFLWGTLRSLAQSKTQLALDPKVVLRLCIPLRFRRRTRALSFSNRENTAELGPVDTAEGVYSDGQRTQQYILEFVDHLVSKLHRHLNGRNVRGIAANFPDFLKAFALKIGQSSSNRTHREVMYFVYKHRSMITKYFQQRVDENDDPHAGNRSTDPILRPDGNVTNLPELPEMDDIDDHEDFDMDQLFQHQALVLDSPAFDWLLGSVLRQAYLTDSNMESMTSIRKHILEALPSIQISRKTSVPFVKVIFRAQWDPISFIREQGYDNAAEDTLGRVITLTGSAGDFQAATCSQYLCQTWPSTGKHMLRMLEETLLEVMKCNGTSQSQRSYILPDKTRLLASYCGGILTVETSGTAYSIAEVGEQLGWIITALRSGPVKSQIASYFPTIRTLDSGEKLPRPSAFQITAVTRPLHADAATGNGQCWHDIFNNPIVVWGYPIPRRDQLQPGTGLEIPLDMLMALVDANDIAEFDNQVFIKGYSAMLIPTRQVDDMILWHLLFNEDSSRISYVDRRTAAFEHVKPAGLRSARHILGWCSEARNQIGSPDANYNIKWSALGKPQGRHAWEKVTISGGTFINLETSFAIGKKDRPVYAAPQGSYKSSLDFIGNQYVVLYDLEDRRAWLVDGLSALLHLVRASLEYDRTDSSKPYFLYRHGQMSEVAPSKHGKDAAVAVLCDAGNCSIRLFDGDEDIWEEETETKNASGTSPVKQVISRKKVTYYTLKHRVLMIISLLEKMFDHLNNVHSESGVGFRLRGNLKNILEGFDFMDVATNQAPLRPHKLSINGSGRGWTDLLRSIHAVTLFGRGFGELIKPVTGPSTPPCDSCGFGITLPVGEDYLGVDMSVVEMILKTKGNTETTPWLLAENIYWHTPGLLFEPCQCARPGWRPKSNCRAQILLPSSHPKLWGRRFSSPKRLESQGAVIFSHEPKMPFRLNHQAQQPQTSQDHARLDILDVGSGTSLDSSSGHSDQLRGGTDSLEEGDSSSVSNVVSPITLPDTASTTMETSLSTETTISIMRPQTCETLSTSERAGDNYLDANLNPAASTGRKRKMDHVRDMVGWMKKVIVGLNSNSEIDLEAARRKRQD